MDACGEVMERRWGGYDGLPVGDPVYDSSRRHRLLAVPTPYMRRSKIKGKVPTGYESRCQLANILHESAFRSTAVRKYSYVAITRTCAKEHAWGGLSASPGTLVCSILEDSKFQESKPHCVDSFRVANME